jgi:hypothetical protein
MTPTLAIKLLLTPVLVAGASLAARRWGPTIAGWLAGFPLTSGPVLLIVTLEHGTGFAAGAARGSVLGVVSQALFAAAYIGGALSGLPWIVCGSLGSLAFAASTTLLSRTDLPPVADAGITAGVLSIALLVLPASKRDVARTPLPRFDLPLRMIVATSLVCGVTSFSGRWGPALTGLVTQYPLYGLVLTVFAHAQEGPSSAAGVMRGLLTGLYGFASFFLVIAVLIDRAGPLVAFLAATCLLVAVQLAALRFVGRNSVRLSLGAAGASTEEGATPPA